LDSIQNYIKEVKPSDNVSARFRLVAITMSVEPATGKEATFSWAPDVDDDLAKGWSGVLAPLINGHEVPCAVQGMSEAWKVEVRLVLTDVSTQVF